MSRLPLLIREMASVEGFPDDFLQKKICFFSWLPYDWLIKALPHSSRDLVASVFPRSVPVSFWFSYHWQDKGPLSRKEQLLCTCVTGGGGGLSFIRGGSATGSNPLTFYIPFFWKKRYSSRIPLMDQWYPWVLSLEHCNPFSCYKCTFSEYE